MDQHAFQFATRGHWIKGKYAKLFYTKLHFYLEWGDIVYLSWSALQQQAQRHAAGPSNFVIN